MKVRKQSAKPCQKKGSDNHLAANTCEIKRQCKSLGGYLYADSSGAKVSNQDSLNSFSGCHFCEQTLIDEKLIRYESKEMTGLEVLFDGIERSDDAESYGGVDYEADFGSSLNSVEIELDYLEETSDTAYFNEETGKNTYIDNILNSLPTHLGYTQSFAHEIFASPPNDIFESFFMSAYRRGEFEHQLEYGEDLTQEGIKNALQVDDLLCAAKCRFKQIDLPMDFKQFWPRFTEKRWNKHNESMNKVLSKAMPFWAKRFNKIWSKLTEAQVEVLKLEYFYDGVEKLTQKENADALGIKESSYKDRLEGAIKKFEKLYPEFQRISRKQKINREHSFEPKPREKKLSSKEKAIIKKWAYDQGYERNESTSDDKIKRRDKDKDFLALDELFSFN